MTSTSTLLDEFRSYKSESVEEIIELNNLIGLFLDQELSNAGIAPGNRLRSLLRSISQVLEVDFAALDTPALPAKSLAYVRRTAKLQEIPFLDTLHEISAHNSKDSIYAVDPKRLGGPRALEARIKRSRQYQTLSITVTMRSQEVAWIVMARVRPFKALHRKCVHALLYRLLEAHFEIANRTELVEELGQKWEVICSLGLLRRSLSQFPGPDSRTKHRLLHRVRRLISANNVFIYSMRNSGPAEIVAVSPESPAAWRAAARLGGSGFLRALAGSEIRSVSSDQMPVQGLPQPVAGGSFLAVKLGEDRKGKGKTVAIALQREPQRSFTYADREVLETFALPMARAAGQFQRSID